MKEFSEIIGYNDVKAELAKICDIMQNGEKYKKLGVTTPRGLLLHGEPGVGKTLMANSLIKASGRNSFTLRKDKPDGDFVNEIRRVFDKAKANAPSIVFLDDMDKFANEDRFHRNAEEFVTVQSCIDDCRHSEVFLLATANNLDSVPGSLLRAGRFDKIIKIENPYGEDAAEIVRYYLGKKNHMGDIDAREIARILNGKSCAELETVINEAGIYAGFCGKEKIEMDDMVKACMDILFNAPESGNEEEMPLSDSERLAYHEAGHAVVAELQEPGSISLVSISSHGDSIGGITSYYTSDSYFYHKEYMENRVRALLGGKAASEIKYGETDVGCNSDMHRAFDIIERFVDDYCSTSFDRWQFDRNNSDALMQRKEMQMTAEMEKYYAETRRLLIKNREFLDKVACALIEKKTLIAKDIMQIKGECGIAA